MDEKNLMTETEDKMKIIVEDYKKDLASMRAGRATPLLLEKVTVEYYGVPTPINQVASIGITPPRTIVIQPWDKKTFRGHREGPSEGRLRGNAQ